MTPGDWLRPPLKPCAAVYLLINLKSRPLVSRGNLLNHSVSRKVSSECSTLSGNECKFALGAPPIDIGLTSTASQMDRVKRCWYPGIDMPRIHRRIVSCDIGFSAFECRLKWMATKAADGKRPYLFRSPSLNFSEKTSEIGNSPPGIKKDYEVLITWRLSMRL